MEPIYPTVSNLLFNSWFTWVLVVAMFAYLIFPLPRIRSSGLVFLFVVYLFPKRFERLARWLERRAVRLDRWAIRNLAHIGSRELRYTWRQFWEGIER